MGKLIGGPDLRARLLALMQVGPEFAAEWADATVKGIEQTKPPSKEPASSRFTTKVSQRRAGVYGAFWWIFVDRGTKAHDIEVRNKRALSNRTTIFGTRAHHRRIARRPFITKAAQNALAGSHWVDTVVKTWNRRRLRSHAGFL